jgi:putative tryptophan/tyrosine transport system substrate-binding protein
MRRRNVIVGLAGAAAWPLAARAQAQGARNPRIGFLYGGLQEAMGLRIGALLDGVRVVDGRHMDVVAKSYVAALDRLTALAKEIADERVDVLFAAGPPAVRAASIAAPSLTLIGLDLETDPVAAGYVSSLARPGGRITGVFLDFPEFSTKWLELLRTVVPKLSQVAVLWDPSTGTLQKDALTRAAGPLGVTLHVFEVNSIEALRGAFAASRARNAEGAVLLSSPIFGSNAAISAELAFEYKLPAVSLFAEFAYSVGLLAYGPKQLELYRQAGIMVGKVLTGAAPADLPVERPSKFQLVVNLKTARALGIELPQTLLLLADEVIE